MAVQRVFVSLLCLVSLAAIYRYNTPTSYNMSSSDLKIQLSSGSSPSVLKVTIENKSPKHTFSLLTWNTPLDEQALNIGALTLEDAETGEAVPGPQMKVNRKLPPPRDAVVEVSPQSTASREVNLSFPWIPKDGKVYRIKTQGAWKAVWAKPASQITDEELSDMIGDSHINENISSESVELQLGEANTS
ncbi:hypothetical protein M436DRAFT_66019 [Aureobasidium namibiae CBS 147.97]|uniref:Secreted protein n=1 Tax=Aureobasidium namibiae CBS 147.97 TaxID=1043004 RepID=A0A074WLH4_9PEZI|nr:uncharacterized protein M436DRAFT_66019 [Aureobasidium namibiae CBS 147.97]KEQ70607.1 hypothetical protein M436DRAFT_66019 [Aureobasidium namibiae CBS 147.97]